MLNQTEAIETIESCQQLLKDLGEYIEICIELAEPRIIDEKARTRLQIILNSYRSESQCHIDNLQWAVRNLKTALKEKSNVKGMD